MLNPIEWWETWLWYRKRRSLLQAQRSGLTQLKASYLEKRVILFSVFPDKVPEEGPDFCSISFSTERTGPIEQDKPRPEPPVRSRRGHSRSWLALVTLRTLVSLSLWKVIIPWAIPSHQHPSVPRNQRSPVSGTQEFACL